jgi:hypothetical protein
MYYENLALQQIINKPMVINNWTIQLFMKMMGERTKKSKRRLGRVMRCQAASVIMLFLVGCGGTDHFPQLEKRLQVTQTAKQPATSPHITPSISVEQLFDWAEVTYPHLFPSPQKTAQWHEYKFRYYAETNMYLGVENGVDVLILGPETQNRLLKVGRIGDFTSRIYNLADPFTNVRQRNSGVLQRNLKNSHLYSDTTSRLIELQKLSGSAKSMLCKPSWVLAGINPRLLKPLLDFDQQDGTYNIPEPLEYAAGQDINFYLSRQSAAYAYHTNLWLRDGNWLAGREVIRTMTNWVDANGLRSVRTPNQQSCFQCYRHALAILLSLDALRSHSSLTPEVLAKILNWVEVFLVRIYIFDELPKGTAGVLDVEQRNNNHNAIRNQLLMAWAILINDPDKFDASIKNGYLKSLETIRADGSFYWDSQRGNWAIWYSNFMAGNLVNMAEMAYGQGIDLYKSSNSSGKNLHDSIDFLMRAKKDFVLINSYANENITNRGGTFTGIQDLSPFSQRKTEWDLWISWMERYSKRFKGMNKDIDSLVLSSRPMVSETDGLATCLSGLID